MIEAMKRLVLMAATLGLLCVAAQQPGQQGMPSQPASEPAKPQQSNAPYDPAQQQTQRQRPYEGPRIYRVEGKVLVAGGAPPDRVLVTATCSGQTVSKVYSDSKGGYSVQLGGSSLASVDASFGRAPGEQSGPASGAPNMGVNDCELQAFLPGFRSSPHKLGIMQGAMYVNHADLVLSQLANVTGFTYSATTMTAPKEAQKALEKGNAAFGKNKLPEAEREFRKAVSLHPKYAAAWYDLGRVLVRAGQKEEAKKALHEAVNSDAKYINPYPVLAQLALEERNWEELAQHTRTVIGLNPFFSENIYVFSAQANLVLERLDLAEAHAREAIRMDRAHRYPMTHRLLARVLTRKGDTNGAIQELRAYLQLAAKSPDAEAVRAEIEGLEQQVSQR